MLDEISNANSCYQLRNLIKTTEVCIRKTKNYKP